MNNIESFFHPNTQIKKKEGVEMSLFKAANDNTIERNIVDEEIYEFIKNDYEVLNNTRFLRDWIKRKNFNPLKPDKNLKSEYQELKIRFKCITFGGVFKDTRNIKNLDVYSGRVVIDIDSISIKQIANLKGIINKWKDVIFLFKSVGGNGLKIVHKLKWNGEDPILFHRTAFNQLEERYKKECNIKIDKSGSDIPRLCYLSHDDGVYYNPNALSLPIEIKEEEIQEANNPFNNWYSHIDYKSKMNTAEAKNELLNVVEFFEKNNIYLFSQYDYWYRTAFAIKNSIDDGPKGYDLFLEISKRDKINFKGEGDVQDKWNRCIPDGRTNTITLGTVLYWASEQGYVIKKQKMDITAFYDYLLTLLINNKIYLRYNEISQEVMYWDGRWKILDDNKLRHIYLDLFGQKMPKNVCNDFLCIIAKPYNPVKDFLSRLKEWKEGDTDYIKELVDTFELEDEGDYDTVYKYISKWMIGAIAGLSESGYNENILMFIGGQGIGKSRWTMKLLPPEFKEYFEMKNIDPTSADDKRLASQNFIIMMDEMSAVINNKANIEDLKNFTTQSSFQIRRPYDVNHTTFRKVASFIGATNEEHILNDLSGNRRFFIVKLKGINSEHSLDTWNVWSQANALFKKGVPYWLTAEEMEEQKEFNEKFEKLSSWEEFIAKYVKPEEGGAMTASDIMSALIEQHKGLSRTSPAYIGKILKKQGYTQYKKENNRVYPVYVAQLIENIIATTIS